MKKYAAEAFGTFALVFFGTGSIITNDLYGNAVTYVGIALTFGLVVMAMIYALGDISGAHLNPAVTLGFWLARRLSGANVIPYILSQFAGALLASLILFSMFPQHPTLGATLPSGTETQSLLMEAILTFVLMFVILTVSTGAKEKGLMAGIAIGGVISLEALVAGAVSGASMNPARSLAPAFFSKHLEHLWLYMVAPAVGAALAVLMFRVVQAEKASK